MIGRISGRVSYRGAGFLLLETGGVGYKIFVTAATYQALENNKPAALWTHLAVREDSQDLYGFETPEELSFFEMLIGVSGIGPKSALAILSIESVETLRSAIASGDSAYLTKVSGIGRKNAEKIILELRDKLGAVYDDTGEHSAGAAEALEALSSLGYGVREARDALRAVPKDITDTGELLREALRRLGNHSGPEK